MSRCIPKPSLFWRHFESLVYEDLRAATGVTFLLPLAEVLQRANRGSKKARASQLLALGRGSSTLFHTPTRGSALRLLSPCDHCTYNCICKPEGYNSIFPGSILFASGSFTLEDLNKRKSAKELWKKPDLFSLLECNQSMHSHQFE